jgi:hypothetical protein
VIAAGAATCEDSSNESPLRTPPIEFTMPASQHTVNIELLVIGI